MISAAAVTLAVAVTAIVVSNAAIIIAIMLTAHVPVIGGEGRGCGRERPLPSRVAVAALIVAFTVAAAVTVLSSVVASTITALVVVAASCNVPSEASVTGVVSNSTRAAIAIATAIATVVEIRPSHDIIVVTIAVPTAFRFCLGPIVAVTRAIAVAAAAIIATIVRHSTIVASIVVVTIAVTVIHVRSIVFVLTATTIVIVVIVIEVVLAAIVAATVDFRAVPTAAVFFAYHVAAAADVVAIIIV